MSIRSYTLLGRIAWWAKRTSAWGANRLWLACEQPWGTPEQHACRLRYYRNVIVNFKPGEYTKKYCFFSSSHKLSLPSFSPPPSPSTRSRAHIFVYLSLRRHPYYLRAWNRLISQWQRRIRRKKSSHLSHSLKRIFLKYIDHLYYLVTYGLCLHDYYSVVM